MKPVNNLKTKVIIGIDPGAQGAIAIYNGRTDEITVHKMPKKITPLKEILQENLNDQFVFLERVSPWKGDIHTPGKMFGINKMMENYTMLRMVIEEMDIPFVYTSPNTWQKTIRRKGESKEARKRRFRDMAQKIYPTVRATLWNADALLIMNYGRIMASYNLNWIWSHCPDHVKKKDLWPWK